MKLNQPLARLGLVVLSIAKTWAYVMSVRERVRPTFVSVASLVGLSGCGATALVALSIDFFTLSLRTYSSHRALCALQHFQCGMLASLSKLFRGKKANASATRGSLRLRYGTAYCRHASFTTFLFLFLTISVYYVFHCVLAIRTRSSRRAVACRQRFGTFRTTNYGYFP